MKIKILRGQDTGDRAVSASSVRKDGREAAGKGLVVEPSVMPEGGAAAVTYQSASVAAKIGDARGDIAPDRRGVSWCVPQIYVGGPTKSFLKVELPGSIA